MSAPHAICKTVNIKKHGPGSGRKLAATKSEPPVGPRTGRGRCDDRGNAGWQWALPAGDAAPGTPKDPLRSLEHPALSLAADAPTPDDSVKANPQGTLKGYDPYDSGKLDKKPPPRKKDLRKLGEWIALRKQAQKNSDTE